MKQIAQRALLIAGLFLAFGMSGCASTDENLTERPWNAPRSWENGIPQSIMQGR